MSTGKYFKHFRRRTISIFQKSNLVINKNYSEHQSKKGDNSWIVIIIHVYNLIELDLTKCWNNLVMLISFRKQTDRRTDMTIIIQPWVYLVAVTTGITQPWVYSVAVTTGTTQPWVYLMAVTTV